MGIFKRIWNWLRSLFGGRKKDEKEELNQYVRQMQEALLNMKAQTEAVLAAGEKRKREIAQCEEQIAKMEKYAEKAVAGGQDSDARFFLEKKASLEKQLAGLKKQDEAAAGYASQAEKLYEKAQAQLNDITARKDAVQAKLAAAELAQSISRLDESSLQESERKAQAALDRAEAMAELENRGQSSDLSDLMSKYDQADQKQADQKSADRSPAEENSAEEDLAGEKAKSVRPEK